MRSLGFLVTGVMASAIVACASGTDASLQGSSDLTETTDAAVTTDGGGADATRGDAGTDAAAAADAAGDAGPAIPTYDDVAPIIAASCTSCHQHAAGDFATRDAVAQNGASMLLLIKRGKMPKGDPTFATTPDGQKLVTYLTFSPDIQ